MTSRASGMLCRHSRQYQSPRCQMVYPSIKDKMNEDISDFPMSSVRRLSISGRKGTYMVNGMKFTSVLKDQNLIFQVRPL